jgi:hypothetical protein
MQYRLFVALLALLVGLVSPQAVLAQGQVQFDDLAVELDFPERATFSTTIVTSLTIERVVLEYGTDSRNCAKVMSKAFATLSEGQPLKASWTWEMLQSGSEPPGTEIWYRWVAIDSQGNEYRSQEQRFRWIDEIHPWQQETRGLITLHWYNGDRAFANELLDTAEEALVLLERDTKVTLTSPTDILIYGNTEEMRDAVLYEPSWTGGLAYSSEHVVIIGIAQSQMEWGKRTVAHELTHILIGDLAFSCIGSVPTWLNEGIAMYAEGSLEASSQSILDAAIANNTLISVRSLNSNFSENPDQAYLSYAQSYSLVDFLIREYSQDQLLELFAALRDGIATEPALEQVYGFNFDGFEQRWREAIGAAPSTEAAATATVEQEPTPIATYAPITIESRPTEAPRERPAATATPIVTLVPTYDTTTQIPTITPTPVGGSVSDTIENPPIENLNSIISWVLLCIGIGMFVSLALVIVLVVFLRRKQPRQ